MSDPRIDPISPEQRAEPVVVVPYDPAWPATFAALRDRIAPVLGEPAVAERLATLGYTDLGDLGIIGREAFRATTELPRHHLYVCAAGSATLQAHLTLRDALRGDAELALAYAGLKRDLAQRYRDDRDTYTEGKSAFVTAVLLRERDGGEKRSLRRG
jgi:GrpB-like predicted nucleotidyltransferase (UPF0157 family)